jgi:hypothetical protein
MPHQEVEFSAEGPPAVLHGHYEEASPYCAVYICSFFKVDQATGRTELTAARRSTRMLPLGVLGVWVDRQRVASR